MDLILANKIKVQVNQNDLTAKIINCNQTTGKLIIPSFIIYQNQRCPITSIATGAFNQHSSVNSIDFDDDCQITTMEESSFSEISIQTLFIPDKVTSLEGFLGNMRFLKKIIVSPNNPHFKFVDNSFLIGKSNDSSDLVLFFAVKTITKAIIPSYIKRIGSQAFLSTQDHLQTITFEKDENGNSQIEEISSKAFYSCNFLRSISIPFSVKRIGPYAFAYSFLHDLVFESSPNHESQLEVIESSAFLRCQKLSSIDFPKSVKSIEKSAFYSCTSLQSINFPSDSQLEEIGNDAFSNTALKSISIPPNVSKLDGFVGYLTKLTAINISPQHAKFAYLSDTLLIEKNQDGTLNDSTLIFVTRDIRKLEIPPFIKRIGISACQDCENLSSIEFPKDSSLEVIEELSFAYCPMLTEVYIPASVKRIGKSAFYRDRSLNKIVFMDSENQESQLEEISDSAFLFCNLRSISIPSKVKIIGSSSFSSCKIGSINFQKNSQIETIGRAAFTCPNSDSISLPDNLQNAIGAFVDFPVLTKISISPSNKHFHYYNNSLLIQKNIDNTKAEIIFARKDMLKVTIPSFVTRICDSAFKSSSMKSIVFDGIDDNTSKLICIDESSFEKCVGLTGISLPSSVAKLGKSAFDSCTNLYYVEILGESIDIGPSCFANIVSNPQYIICPNAKHLTIQDRSFAYYSWSDPSRQLITNPCSQICYQINNFD